VSEAERESGDSGPTIRVEVPDGEVNGRYANFLTVWHTPHEFTLDFGVIQPAEVDDDDGTTVVPCPVVARLKIAPSLVFDVLRALNDNMTRYESKFGEISRPTRKRPCPYARR
jgi:hypothetical protein